MQPNQSLLLMELRSVIYDVHLVRRHEVYTSKQKGTYSSPDTYCKIGEHSILPSRCY